MTRTASDEYVFKSPSLRNIDLTAPYFHSGKVWNLEQAVAIMGSAQLGSTLDNTDTESIVAFLKTVTGQQPRVDYPCFRRIPRRHRCLMLKVTPGAAALITAGPSRYRLGQHANSQSLCAGLAGVRLGHGQQIADPKQALNVMDFELAARSVLPPAHFGYLATGVEDDLTLKANRDGFSRLHLRPKRLIDITRVDMHGIVRQHVGYAHRPGSDRNQKAFHAEGEIPVAKAARATRSLADLSTATNSSVEDVSEALGRPVWYQLYTTSRWEYTEKLVRRVEAAGCPVLAVTVDTQAGSRRETFERSKSLDKRDCVSCHGTTPEDFFRRKPMFQGMDVSGLRVTNPAMTWSHLEMLRKMAG